MIPDVLLLRRQGQRLLQAELARPEFPPLHVDHAQVVLALNVTRLNLQDPETGVGSVHSFLPATNIPSVARLRGGEVFLVVCVNVPHENQSLDVLREVMEQLLERLESF